MIPVQKWPVNQKKRRSHLTGNHGGERHYPTSGTFISAQNSRDLARKSDNILFSVLTNTKSPSKATDITLLEVKNSNQSMYYATGTKHIPIKYASGSKKKDSERGNSPFYAKEVYLHLSIFFAEICLTVMV